MVKKKIVKRSSLVIDKGGKIGLKRMGTASGKSVSDYGRGGGLKAFGSAKKRRGSK